VIFASSSSTYGAGKELPKREDMPALPISPYAVGKLAAENYCRAFSEVFDLETVCLRYFNVFGPRQDPLSQYAAVIPNFITAFLREEPSTVYGDGEQTRDFTYVDNIVQANILAADAMNVSGRTYNVAVGSSISLNQIIEQLQQLTGLDLEPVYVARRPGDVPHSLADVSRAMRDLGYVPEVRFEDGLQRTLEFQRSLPAPSRAPATA
jgi:nucleoside-diphosphate-sugar epimerase